MRRAGAAVWRFVVGDDWLTALGVALALGLTAVIASWWLLPPVVCGLLWLSVRRLSAGPRHGLQEPLDQE